MKVCFNLNLREGHNNFNVIADWPLSVLPRTGEYIRFDKNVFSGLPEWACDD